MIRTPEIVTPVFSELESRRDHTRLRDLKFPENKREIARLSLQEKAIWYAAQDPQELIEANPEFVVFWHRKYVFPLHWKRRLYWFKFW